MLAGLAPPTDGATALVISGANVDPQDYAAIIGGQNA